MAKKNMEWWKERLNRSSFFFIALFLHVLILAMVATLVIFEPNILSTPDFTKVYLPTDTSPPPPPAASMAVSVPTMTVPVTAPTITSPNATASFTIPPPDLNTVVDVKGQSQVRSSVIAGPTGNNLGARLPGIRATVQNWRTPENIRNSNNDVHNLVAKFPVYLAQYADGDWYCNNYTNNAKHRRHADGTEMIIAGCLPNLIYQVGIWSQGNIKGQEVKVIAIDSPELLSNPPPYIFFTGHRDFHLTDAEIENLQKYLQIGGAIWGDSAFSGDGSRFDVAFHREMKRVLPDADKNFEPLPMTHAIFTHSWFPIDKIPPGMNYRADPVEIINLDGKLAVIYTPNDYSDMMTMVLLAGADPPQVDSHSFWPWAPTQDHPLFTPTWFYGSRMFFFRNYQPDSVQDSYKLSINILAHLLIRFDSDLQMAP